MKYSPFLWPPVLQNLFYYAFWFVTIKECIHRSSSLPPPPACLLPYLIFDWTVCPEPKQCVWGVYGTCFLVLYTSSFPECKLWIKNTFLMWGGGSNLASSETALCNSSSGCTAKNLSLSTSSLWSQPDFFAVSSFLKAIILINEKWQTARLLLSLYIYKLLFMRFLQSPTEFVEFAWHSS